MISYRKHSWRMVY